MTPPLLAGVAGRIFTKHLLGFTLAIACLGLVAEAGESAPAAHGQASYYWAEACRWNPDPACPTASGLSLYDLINQQFPYAASWQWPLHTQLNVCAEKAPRRCTTVVVLDRGPAKRLRRLIDLNPWSFRYVCGDLDVGTCQVTVEAL